MHVLSYIEASEYFLNHHCLLGKVAEILFIMFLHSFSFELFTSIKTTKQRLNFDGGFFLAEKLFALLKHSKLGLNFE